MTPVAVAWRMAHMEYESELLWCWCLQLVAGSWCRVPLLLMLLVLLMLQPLCQQSASLVAHVTLERQFISHILGSRRPHCSSTLRVPPFHPP
jgi:hypothetical protein